MTSRDRGPSVFVPPPLFFIGGWVGAWFLDGRIGFAIVGAGAGVLQEAVGLGLLAVGLAVMTWAILTFLRARTPIAPIRPARQLVRTGPYQFSRNPMYVGLTTAYVGLALLMNRAWPLVTLPAVLVAVRWLVIGREEAHLSAAFGTEYRDYRSCVRRWL